MAGFAELDNNNKVIRSLEVDDKHCGGPDDTGDAIGQNFLRKILFNPNATWKRTSVDLSFRGRLAAKDLIYDEVKDIFIPSQPYPSWTLNETTYEWDPPIPQSFEEDILINIQNVPTKWDEDSQSWLKETELGSGIWE